MALCWLCSGSVGTLWWFCVGSVGTLWWFCAGSVVVITIRAPSIVAETHVTKMQTREEVIVSNSLFIG